MIFYSSMFPQQENFHAIELMRAEEEPKGKTDKKIEKFNLKTAVYCLIN